MAWKVGILTFHCAHNYGAVLQAYATQALLSAIPVVGDNGTKRERILLEGDIPSPVNPPSGCRFHTRCPYATERCATEVPEMVHLGGEHQAACLLCVPATEETAV